MSNKQQGTGHTGKKKDSVRSEFPPRHRDTGSGDLYPFSPLEGGARHGAGAERVSSYARDGHPGRLVEMTPQGRVSNLGEPLDWYCRRRPDLFPACLYAAGDWLRCVYEQAMNASLSMAKVDPGQPVSAKTGASAQGMAPAERAAERMRSLRRALAAVGGPDLDEILLRVVCEAMPMAGFEKMKGWRAGAGQWILRIALYRLALHRGTVTARGLPRWKQPPSPENENAT